LIQAINKLTQSRNQNRTLNQAVLNRTERSIRVASMKILLRRGLLARRCIFNYI